MKKPRIEIFEKLVRSKSGNLTSIAEAIGVTRRAVELWLEKDEKFKQIKVQFDESMLDLCETQTYNLIKGIPRIIKNAKGDDVFDGWNQEPDRTLMIFMLKTKGKHRGWVERQEIMNMDNNGFLDILKRASQREEKEKNEA